ncbi:DUF1499 domain-containing protein [Thalassobius sp. S69A]|uniref:DUF1499 domain-containing protein n=1 Tax=unclassified Thalassovita TaxID=2619711 RepID=UPI000C5DBEBF|nr:hypothetical protein [Paracoccaceae bacterium]
MNWLYVIVVLVVGFGLYVRLAPSDPARWHQPIKGAQDKDFKGGALRILPGSGAETFAALDRIIQASPRTSVLAGSLADGEITYITRSALWGFPDYTTLELRKNGVAILGRLRFGRSDLGVNKARIQGWLDALAQK